MLDHRARPVRNTVSTWRSPGRAAAVLYAVAAAVLGLVTATVSRVTIERQRGRRRLARALPADPIIVIANHTSYADGVLLALACRRLGRSLRLLAKAGLFRVPLFGRALRSLGFIPVARGEAGGGGALDAAAQALADGEAIGIFPEGTITDDPNRWPLRSKTGAVRLALRTGAPIVPVAMVGAEGLVDRKGNVRRLLKNLVLRPRVEIAVGDTIDVRALAGGRHDPPPDVVRQLADVVMGELVALLADVRGGDPDHAVGAPRTNAAGSR
jgi:1-acyl-sn-glycerol-3-phosphate acyltransferase